MAQAKGAYETAAAALSAARQGAGDGLSAAVRGELAPLEAIAARRRFAVAVTAAGEERAGPSGISMSSSSRWRTLPGAPLGPLGAIASGGGELGPASPWALKACLAGRGAGAQPVMVFDEVDQGVGGAVADAVGQRLARLATAGQVLVVTHSPQVAARADAHWRVGRTGDGAALRAEVETVAGHPSAREEEIARMLAGAVVTDAARAAARALMHV